MRNINQQYNGLNRNNIKKGSWYQLRPILLQRPEAHKLLGGEGYEGSVTLTTTSLVRFFLFAPAFLEDTNPICRLQNLIRILNNRSPQNTVGYVYYFVYWLSFKAILFVVVFSRCSPRITSFSPDHRCMSSILY